VLLHHFLVDEALEASPAILRLVKSIDNVELAAALLLELLKLRLHKYICLSDVGVDQSEFGLVIGI
jgi:hypothetical protein